MTPGQIKQIEAQIEELRTYRMSFMDTAVQGEFIINGLILDRILPSASIHSNATKKVIKEFVLTAIDNRIDFLVGLLKEKE